MCFESIRKDERVSKRRDSNFFIKKVMIKEIIYDLDFLPFKIQAYSKVNLFDNGGKKS